MTNKKWKFIFLLVAGCLLLIFGLGVGYQPVSNGVQQAATPEPEETPQGPVAPPGVEQEAPSAGEVQSNDGDQDASDLGSIPSGGGQSPLSEDSEESGADDSGDDSSDGGFLCFSPIVLFFAIGAIGLTGSRSSKKSWKGS